jgi:hypothetical protein
VAATNDLSSWISSARSSYMAPHNRESSVWVAGLGTFRVMGSDFVRWLRPRREKWQGVLGKSVASGPPRR